MDKVKMTTPDGVTENIEKLAALFPAAVTEMRGEDGTLRKGIDFEKLRQLLSRDIVEGGERYEFSWVGKKAAMAEAARPTTETLRPVKADSRNWDTTENLYIEGDNLAALKILQESYLGKVKMIYIDPPYNTGNDFIYADDFMRTQDEENEQMGMFDEDENHLFKNTDNRGRFHSDWCSMMYSRLMMARNLLADDGVIFISIDDNEQDRLKAICNEIFGATNFVCQFSIASNSSKNNSKFVSITHEYLLCYAKCRTVLPTNWAVLRNATSEYIKRAKSLVDSGLSEDAIHNELMQLTKYPRFYEFDHFTYADEYGIYQTSDLTAPNSKNKYDIIHPRTHKPCFCGTRGWAYTKENVQQLIDGNRVSFGYDEKTIPRLKNYLTDNENITVLPKSVLFFDSQGTTKWMKAQGFGFDFPKALDYIKYVISMYPEKDFTILDFFSGSATTAHAVMQLNAEDGGHRKFIMVQLPEPCDEKSEAYKAGYKNICEIGKERIRRAGDKIKTEHPDADLDIGFRVFRVDSSNTRDVYYKPEEFTQTMLGEAVSNIKPDRTDLDLLYACLLDCGVPIHLPHTTTTVDGCTIHNVDNGALMACFDEHIPHSVIRAMAAEAPLQVIFRDSAFAADADKINVTEIFKNLSPDTKVRVI